MRGFLLFLFLTSISSFELRAESPEIKALCKNSQGFTMNMETVACKASLCLRLAWEEERREGALVHEELYKAYVLYFPDGRFVFEEGLLEGRSVYAKLSFHDGSAKNLVCRPL